MRAFYFVLAWISFVLGLIGIVVPVLPTTPFMILAAFLFSKSSERWHQWMLQLPFAGKAILQWRQHRVINIKAKVLATVVMGISAWVIWTTTKIQFPIKTGVIGFMAATCIFIWIQKSKPSRK
jgi:uncharacterized membrane protein YbaN (DUF454 family)